MQPQFQKHFHIPKSKELQRFCKCQGPLLHLRTKEDGEAWLRRTSGARRCCLSDLGAILKANHTKTSGEGSEGKNSFPITCELYHIIKYNNCFIYNCSAKQFSRQYEVENLEFFFVIFSPDGLRITPLEKSHDGYKFAQRHVHLKHIAERAFVLP